MKKTKLFLMTILIVSIFIVSVNGVIFAQDEKPKVAMVTAQRLGDKGVTDLCYDGFTRAAEDFNLDPNVVEVQKGEYQETLFALAESDYEVIVVLWAELVDATKEVAQYYPDTKFISILGNFDAENVKCALGEEHEGSYLAGMLAGLKTETDYIGFVGGSNNPEINRFLAGYQQGALAVNPDIKVDAVYVGSFEDPTKGKDLSLMLYNQGVDVVYAAAAKSGLGLFDAVEETNKYAIGCDVNQNHLVPGNVLGSMTIRYDRWIYDGLREFHEGEFEPGVTWYGLENDNLKLVLPDDSMLETSPETVEKIEKAREQIINGEIEIQEEPLDM